MRKLRRTLCGRIVSTIVGAVFLFTVTIPQDAHAAFKDALSEMFIASGTEAQAINTQRLRGYYGGNLALRSPGRSFEIVQFAAPKIDAGCGGIDIFFGSFSFINGAQFEQLIRSIAANAVGYAIKLAIQSMCSPCGGVLDKLEQAMQKLNALAKNTCATVMSAMDKSGASAAIMETGRKIGEALGVSANRVADSSGASNKSLSEKSSQTASGGDPVVAKSNPVLGNLVWRAAKETMGNGNNTLRAFLTDREVTEMVMSVFGTVVTRPVEPGDPTCDASVSPERCDNFPVPYKSTISHWDKLLRARTASPEGIGYWRCVNYDEGCTKVISMNISADEWGGVEDLVNKALFGTVDPSNDASYTPNSLIGSFVHQNGVSVNGSNLSVEARKIVAVIPVPIIPMLLELQKNRYAVRTLGLYLSKQLPKYFEYTMALELQNIAANTFSNQNIVDPPQAFMASLTDKSNQLTAMRPQSQDLMDIIDGTYKIMQQYQTLTVSPVRSSRQ